MSSESTSHYANLSDTHGRAAAAADRLKAALLKKAEAEKEILKARRDLHNAHVVITRWNLEGDPNLGTADVTPPVDQATFETSTKTCEHSGDDFTAAGVCTICGWTDQP